MIRLLVAFLLLASSAEATERFVTNNGQVSGTCTTSGTACTFKYAVQTFATAGEIFTLLDGTYQGADNMPNLASYIPNVSGSSGNVITVRALNDGAAIFDGQYTNDTLYLSGNNYWSFSGFDVGYGARGAVQIYQSGHNTFQRICAYHANHVAGVIDNEHVWTNWNSSNNLYEDICGFGYGRNTFIDFDPNTNNVYRRLWLSFQGYPCRTTGGNPCDHPGPQLQSQYDTSNSSGNNLWENMITVYNPEHQDEFTQWTAGFGAGSATNGIAQPGQYTFAGIIAYGYDGPLPSGTAYKTNPKTTLSGPGGGFWWGHMAYPNIDKDFFLDARSHDNVYPIQYACNLYPDPNCTASTNSADRVTVIRGTTDNNITVYGPTTNFNSCTSLSACPNFYTGDSPGTGSRACFRYSGGTLTSTPLWPWPMDDRIKAALARTSSRTLDGTAGSGYAAGTVTSEIVSRYGSIPTACLTSSSFTPSFPVASDFPSVSVRDDFDRVDAGTLGGGWTELLGDAFSIVSNAASGPSGFARSVYSDTKLQTDHEVYATFQTLAAASGYSTILSFAGTDLTVNNQYRVRVNRTSGSNSTIDVRRIDGVGTDTGILSDVDLGIEVADGNSYGVRVSGTTISIYWKWTDGIWYRVAQFTDSNLSSLPSTGVYGGMAGGTGTVIDNFGAGPFVDQPVQAPPSPPPSVGAGRFGTTFPSVR